MAKKPLTAAEKRHFARLRELPCILHALLGEIHRTEEIHHPRMEQGGGQRAPHWTGVPLCREAHTGPLGIHGDKTLMRLAKVDELDLVGETNRRLFS